MCRFPTKHIYPTAIGSMFQTTTQGKHIAVKTKIPIFSPSGLQGGIRRSHTPKGGPMGLQGRSGLYVLQPTIQSQIGMFQTKVTISNQTYLPNCSYFKLRHKKTHMVVKSIPMEKVRTITKIFKKIKI